MTKGGKERNVWPCLQRKIKKREKKAVRENPAVEGLTRSRPKGRPREEKNRRKKGGWGPRMLS